jgi:hypothetical protein
MCGRNEVKITFDLHFEMTAKIVTVIIRFLNFFSLPKFLKPFVLLFTTFPKILQIQAFGTTYMYF